MNRELKRIAAATGIPVAPQLNAEFQARLRKLKAVPAADFDAAYVADMKSIHDGDEKLFAAGGTGWLEQLYKLRACDRSDCEAAHWRPERGIVPGLVWPGRSLGSARRVSVARPRPLIARSRMVDLSKRDG